jgi:hypothetical protein
MIFKVIDATVISSEESKETKYITLKGVIPLDKHDIKLYSLVSNKNTSGIRSFAPPTRPTSVGRTGTGTMDLF